MTFKEYKETYYRDKTLKYISYTIWGTDAKIAFLSQAYNDKLKIVNSSQSASELINYAKRKHDVELELDGKSNILSPVEKLRKELDLKDKEIERLELKCKFYKELLNKIKELSDNDQKDD